jgi:hypothetical protein
MPDRDNLAAAFEVAAVDVTNVAEPLEQLLLDGWAISESLRSSRLTSPPGLVQDTGDRLLRSLLSLQPILVEAEISSDVGVRLSVSNGAAWVRDVPTPVADYFDGPALRVAERARDGDVDAAVSLVGNWSAEATVDLAQPIPFGAGGYTWRVVRHEQVVVDAFQSLEWWRIGELVRGVEQQLIVLVLNANEDHFVTGAFIVAGPRWHQKTGQPDVHAKRASVLASSGFLGPAYLCLPEELGPEQRQGFAQLHSVCAAYAAASAWAWLANSVLIDGSDASLEFFGFQRVRQRIDREGLTEPAAQVGAMALYMWTTAEESPDRVLAVRQVVSVYGNNKVLSFGTDVRNAAEPIYRQLRSSAIEIVFTTIRETRKLAIDTGRAASDSAQAAMKSTTERLIAAVSAIGVLVLTKAVSTSVSDRAFQELAYAVAAFMLVLAGWSWKIETTALAAPLSAFLTDLDRVADILSDEQRNEIRRLSSIQSSLRRASLLNWLLPVSYVLVAAVAVTISFFPPSAMNPP